MRQGGQYMSFYGLTVIGVRKNKTQFFPYFLPSPSALFDEKASCIERKVLCSTSGSTLEECFENVKYKPVATNLYLYFVFATEIQIDPLLYRSCPGMIPLGLIHEI